MVFVGLIGLKAQANMYFTISGTSVTFKVIPTSPGDWGGSNPINIYAYTNAGDTTPAGTGVTNVLGGWPGTALTNNGDGSYSTTVDLATLYPAGTTVNVINFIYNDGTGNQNPPSGQSGFLSTDTAHASGWTPVLIPVLGVFDLNGLSKKSVVAEGKLYTAQKGNLTLEVYEFGGKLVKTMKVSANDSAIDLNLPKKGLYLVKIAGSNSEVVKFSY